MNEPITQSFKVTFLRDDRGTTCTYIQGKNSSWNVIETNENPGDFYIHEETDEKVQNEYHYFSSLWQDYDVALL
jgi:hypothetical protein